MKANEPDLLAAYRLALVFGIVPPQTVASLVSRLMLEADRLSPELLVAAEARVDSIAELTSALTALSSGADSHRASRLFMGIAHQQLLHNPDLAEDVTRALDHLASTRQAPSEAEGEMFAFNDLFHCAYAGIYGHREDVVRDLIAFLERHALCPDA
ncbi:MAG: hypothetical protein AB2L07_21955 [Thermoanaerobaculaceae bacterium]